MLRRQASFSIIFFLLIADLNAIQIDPELCPNGPSSPIPDPLWSPIPSRFEIFTEMSTDNQIVELSQAFSQPRDSVFTNSPEGSLQFYTNVIDNERFTVFNLVINSQVIPVCLRQPILLGAQISVLEPGSLYLKPSILLGFDQSNQKNNDWGIAYAGDTNVRGIPARIFRSCFFVSDIQSTVAATYYVSDPNQFSGYLGPNQVYILQIDVRIKNSAGRKDQYSYHVFRYQPNPTRLEERQSLETPAGVYCPNRTSGLPVPSDIPSRVIANSEIYLPSMNNSIYSAHRLYDDEFQFTRLEIWYPDPLGSADWFHYSEIHDFATGLSYSYDHRTRQCTVSNITSALNDGVPSQEDPNLVQIGSPEHIFLLDDMDYQYTGQKRCRDRAFCHVWIGEKQNADNTTEHREWYWAESINDQPLLRWIPVKFVFKKYRDGVLINSNELSVFNFRRNPLTLLEVDFALADCYRALGPTKNFNIAVLSFKINNPKKVDVLSNLNYLRVHIWETLTFTMLIRPIRISNMIIDRDADENILVTFTLLDAPPQTGPVEAPLKEKSLDKLIERLESAINGQDFLVRARFGTRQINLRAEPNSLNIQHRSTETNTLHSGPRITGLWIGFILVGVLVGVMVGFVALKKLAK